MPKLSGFKTHFWYLTLLPMLRILNDTNSILNSFIAELRDKDVQQDSMRFRKNLERIGEIFAYEISKTFSYTNKEVNTPLGVSTIALPENNIFLATLVRSGIPFQNGFLNIFDNAHCAFISVNRKTHSDGSFNVSIGHVSSPSLDNKVLILIDPLIASGTTMVKAYQSLIEKGKPKKVHLVSIISSNAGIAYVQKKLNTRNMDIWTGAIDDELTVKSYIVPGLGDVGDLAFGSKV
jgi:uracil phosphoribosyltransferase